MTDPTDRRSASSPSQDREDAATAGPAGSGGRRSVAWVPDLMDRSKLSHVPALEMASSLEELVRMSPGAEVAVLDLSRPGALEAVGRLGARRVVGFVGHVDRATAEAAQALGCEVVPRSKLFGRRSDAVAVLSLDSGAAGGEPRSDAGVPDRPPSANG